MTKKQRFEYKNIQRSIEFLQDTLDEYAIAGWQLHSAQTVYGGYNLIFERPVEQPITTIWKDGTHGSKDYDASAT